MTTHSIVRSLALFSALLVVLPAVGCSREDTNVPIEIAEAPTDPQLLQMAGAVAHNAVLAESDGEVLARLRIDTSAIPGATRPPMNLGLAIDTSGSMAGDAMAQSREAALAIIDQLDDGDRIAVVSFGSRTQVVTAATVVDATTRSEIRARIEAMSAAGTTDLTGGVSQAVAEVLGAVDPNGVNRVVLLSDGVPNDSAGLEAVAEQARAHAVSITALGLGLESDEVLLTRLAQHTGGRYHYVEEPAMVAQVFRDEILRIERVVARNLQLQLRPGPGVVIHEIVGLQWNRQGAAGATVALGDLSEGETRDVVIRMSMGPHRDGASIELADAFLSFEDTAVGAGYLTRDAYISTKAVSDAEAVAAAVDVSVEASAEKALAAAAILTAIDLQRNGQVAAALAQLSSAETRARDAADRLGDDALTEAADEMVSLRDAWPPQTAVTIAGPQAELTTDLGRDGNEIALDVGDLYGDRTQRESAQMPDSPAPAPQSMREDFAPPPPTRMKAAQRKKVKRSHARAMRALQPYAS